MKKEIFEQLQYLFGNTSSILEVADEVQDLRLQLTEEIDVVNFVNLVREKVQDEALQAFILNGGRGIIAMATGSGKSKVAIEAARYYKPVYPESCIALIVPTEKLRDENWKEEFNKWGADNLWSMTERLCYASASKVSNIDASLLILDEGHNITSLSATFFGNNAVEHVILLTATVPTDIEKLEILSNLKIPVVYNLSLDNAVKLGFVAPYKITVVYTELNSAVKDVLSGNKKNPFYTTERAGYDYLTSSIDSFKDRMLTIPEMARRKFAILNRMHFIYKLKTKTVAAQFLLDNIIPKEDRTLIFCGGILQADLLCEDRFHSKTNSKSYDLFKKEEISRLSCVKAINEGHNFPGIDRGVIVQLNSKEKDLVQRLGRLLRFRFGHEGHLYIIVAKGTQDEIWLESALDNFDKNNIDYVEFKDLKS